MLMKRIILAALLLAGIFSLGASGINVGVSSNSTNRNFAAIPAVAVFETSVVPTPTPDPAMLLRRGVNMANMLEAPVEGELGLTAHEEYFKLVQQAGFDFVRMPIRWDAHAAATTPYTIDPKFFDRVDEIIGWATENHLTIILDFHNYADIMTDPTNSKSRFLAIWQQISEHYKSYPPQVIFELLNEPNDLLNPAIWNQYLQDALSIIRATNPTREVVIDSAQSSSYDWITTLDVPNDPNIMVTFHYYDPFHFTHQGANWIGQDSRSWLGTTWDASPAQEAAITSSFDLVANWANQHHVRILLGEFGAFSAAEMASRVRWTSFVAREAEKDGFAWAYWEFGAGFGIYDPNTNTWRQELLKALIP